LFYGRQLSGPHRVGIGLQNPSVLAKTAKRGAVQSAGMHSAAVLRSMRAESQPETFRLPFGGSSRAMHSWCAYALPVLPGLAVALLLAVGMAPGRCRGASLAVCNGCDLFLGIGNTYHFWGDTGGLVIPVTLTLDDGRYELGLFRMTSRQTLFEDIWEKTRVMAEPYWGVSASRRWQLASGPTWRLFFGFGASYKAEEDLLNATHWNFASQLGVRLHHASGKGADMEFAIRHWSNAGIRTPNRGQDFFTVTVGF
jgi:hypothetical protein